jgi:hypothetical protein
VQVGIDDAQGSVLGGVEVEDGLEEPGGILDGLLVTENLFNQEIGQWGNEFVKHILPP